MNHLNSFQVTTLTWHLQNNVFPLLTNSTISRIIDSINSIRDGSRNLDDLISSSSDCTIGEMITDLRLEDYLPQTNFNYYSL